jgi:uncharacterized protein YodC (DUF2158 family)
MSVVDVVEMLTGMYCMRWYGGRGDDGSEVPKFKEDGSREGVAPQNSLTRTAEPHGQPARAACEGRAKKGTLRIHLQPAQPASHSSRPKVASRPKSEV